MDDTGHPAENRQTDVDEDISAASSLQEDTQRGQDEGEDDLADVAGSRRSSGISMSITLVAFRGVVLRRLG